MFFRAVAGLAVSGCQSCNPTILIRHEAGMVMVFPPEGVRSVVDGVS